jgi:hypothetical protein
MTDIIANDDERRWAVDQAALPAEREWDDAGQRSGVPKVIPNPRPDYSERSTAAARWEWSILIIAALSALSWAAVILFVIAALSALSL